MGKRTTTKDIAIKRVIFELPNDLCYRLKIGAATEGISQKQFVINAVEKQLKNSH